MPPGALGGGLALTQVIVWTTLRHANGSSASQREQTHMKTTLVQEVQPAPAEMGASTTVDARLSRSTATAILEVSLHSQPPSALLRLPDRRYSKTLEVVRVQRHLLHNNLLDGNDDYDIWTSTYVVVDYIDLTTKKRLLRIWYENGDEEDVCEGIADRPEHGCPASKRPPDVDADASNVRCPGHPPSCPLGAICRGCPPGAVRLAETLEPHNY
jgi:hypothetical protein